MKATTLVTILLQLDRNTDIVFNNGKEKVKFA